MRRELEEIAEQRLAGIDFPIPQTCAQEWLKYALHFSLQLKKCDCRYSVIRDPIVNHINKLREPTNEYEHILADIKKGHFDDIAKRAAEEANKSDSPFRLECMVLAARFYTFHNNLNKVREWLDKFLEAYNALCKLAFNLV